MCIVTGPSIDIATKLIGRLKNIFGTRFVSFFAIKRQCAGSLMVSSEVLTKS